MCILIWELFLLYVSIINDSFIKKNWGRCGGGAGNKMEVCGLSLVPAPEVLRSKTSILYRFAIAPAEGVEEDRKAGWNEGETSPSLSVIIEE